ncbi:MAG TPA: aromatic amino acid lyase, partial [Candidatus Acidoferrales bacterium]|nr:aromatic amino acid lyase [Candidatus Acidoferrales bacterium]
MMQLSGQPLTLAEIAAIAAGDLRVEIAPHAIPQMAASERVVRDAAANHNPVYGINTGFGKLCEVRIPDDAIERLQLNLVRSHACGLGRPLSEPETRVVMALRANTLA